jgi:hypothetical protein
MRHRIRLVIAITAALSAAILGVALVAPASASAAAPLQVCRIRSTSTYGYRDIVDPREWRCDPSAPKTTAYATSNMFIPAHGGYPETHGFVWQELGAVKTPYATVVKFTENNTYGVLQAWLPLGNGNLTEMRCWRFAGEAIEVEVQPNECAARLGEALA